MKIPLTDVQRAAILAGAVDIEVAVDASEQQATAGASDAETDPAIAAAAAAAAATAAAEAQAVADAAAAAAAAPAVESELVKVLRAELATSQASLVTAQVEIAQLKASSASTEACLPKLLAIAQGAVGHVQVALGGSNSAEAMDAKTVVAEHDRLMPLFAAKFKVGGIAVTTPPVKKEVAVDPTLHARLASFVR
jgi:hypothetical protein